MIIWFTNLARSGLVTHSLSRSHRFCKALRIGYGPDLTCRVLIGTLWPQFDLYGSYWAAMVLIGPILSCRVSYRTHWLLLVLRDPG